MQPGLWSPYITFPLLHSGLKLTCYINPFKTSVKLLCFLLQLYLKINFSVNVSFVRFVCSACAEEAIDAFDISVRLSLYLSQRLIKLSNSVSKLSRWLSARDVSTLETQAHNLCLGLCLEKVTLTGDWNLLSKHKLYIKWYAAKRLLTFFDTWWSIYGPN